MFAENIFANQNLSAKFAKIFSRENFPLYGIPHRISMDTGNKCIFTNIASIDPMLLLTTVELIPVLAVRL